MKGLVTLVMNNEGVYTVGGLREKRNMLSHPCCTPPDTTQVKEGDQSRCTNQRTEKHDDMLKNNKCSLVR